ncbi:MAG: tRNA (adenosine(37)-N6)-threonylcarbamoyltransferase complex dimerization subunit type 1 TsaB [Firmicutes bacterium]|nr:tRNA (adenosine(37)-N6)-threonylcarbamoyltransferase complex dimerization subunit type 1 TsaB [Bacillota bacterium]
MIVLAIDSTEKTASAALCDGERLIGEYTLDCGNTHSETLLPMVESLLNNSHLTVSDIELFACSAGPGSFTGVRIGVSLIKGLAFGRNKPCIGVSALEALAYNCQGMDGIACPVMDARRGQLYNALFRIKDREVVRLCSDRVIMADELMRMFPLYDYRIMLCGGGIFEAEKAALEAGLKCVCTAPAALSSERAYSVARCAVEKYKSDPSAATSDLLLSPVYLRLSQAERMRENGKSEGTV